MSGEILVPPLSVASVKVNPNTVAPVTVTFVFSPPVLVMVRPLPVVGIDMKLHVRWVLASLFDVPTISFVVAHDIG
jgi:hypothetical protein